MIDLTLGEIAALSGGVWTGEAALLNAHPAKIVTDSRDAGEGSLFIAFRGEHTDGHRYIPDVWKRGALAVLCEEKGAAGEGRIVVEEVFAALRKIASARRDERDIPFVGVTGSVGKTTAKEMIAAVLSEHFATFKTPGSMNGQVGVPIALMTMPHGTEAAVVEMGISLPGEMKKLGELVRPGVGVFMNIADAHLEALHDREGVLWEKCDMLCAAGAEGVAVVNGDDTLLRGHDFGVRKITFGLGGNCDVRAESLGNGDQGQRWRILAGAHDFPVEIPAYGVYMVYAALAAAAVGFTLGLTEEEIATGIGHYATVGHRSRLLRVHGMTIVDDCYNANPYSDRFAIDSLMELPGRHVCVLGDMNELGENSAELHRGIGAYARDKGVDALYTAGKMSVHYGEGAGGIARHFESREALAKALPALLREGDAVLIKASHSCRFEYVLDALLEEE